MPNRGEDLAIVRVAARSPEDASGHNVMSVLKKEFHRLDLQRISSNLPVNFCLTLGDANVILDSNSEVTLSTPAAQTEWAR